MLLSVSPRLRVSFAWIHFGGCHAQSLGCREALNPSAVEIEKVRR